MILPAQGEPCTPDAAGLGGGAGGEEFPHQLLQKSGDNRKPPKSWRDRSQEKSTPEEGSLPGQAESQGHHGPALD